MCLSVEPESPRREWSQDEVATPSGKGSFRCQRHPGKAAQGCREMREAKREARREALAHWATAKDQAVGFVFQQPGPPMHSVTTNQVKVPLWTSGSFLLALQGGVYPWGVTTYSPARGEELSGPQAPKGHVGIYNTKSAHTEPSA